MSVESVFILMIGCTFFVIFEGVKTLFGIPRPHLMAREAEQIFNSRVFEKEEVVREKLAEYFHGLERKVKIVNLSFVFAYVMMSLMLHMIAPGSSVWASFGVILVFFPLPLGIGLLLAYDIRLLKREMTDRLNAH